MNNIKIAKELIKIAKDLTATFDDFGYSINDGYNYLNNQNVMEKEDLYYVAIQTEKVDAPPLNQTNNKNDKKYFLHEQNSIEGKKDKAIIIGLAKPDNNNSANILRHFHDATLLYKEIKSYLEKQCSANFNNKNFKKVWGDVIREGSVEQSEICYYLSDQDIKALLDKFFDKVDNPCEFL